MMLNFMREIQELKIIASQKLFHKGLDHIREKIDSEAFLRSHGHEQPLRSELFSADQLESHARKLAGWHAESTGKGKDLLLPRLAENEEILLQVYQLLVEAAASNLRVAPASGWLLDNFYKVEEQIRIARHHLPKNYSRELPQLTKGPLAGFPRVYDLARELVLHTDGRVGYEDLKRFISAYQGLRVLNLGELWAIPIMLRLALIENLRRISLGIANDRIDRNKADFWADLMINAAENDPKSMIRIVADLAESNPPMSHAFVAELSRRLEGQSRILALPLTWIEQRLSEMGITIEQMVQLAIQKEAADKVSVGNSIESFRFIDSTDWRKFVEELSVVEATLSKDPSNVYCRMDFLTRDRYRHVIEKISKNSDLSEEEIAVKAVELAEEQAASIGADDRKAHIGFFLIDKGRPLLEKAANAKVSVARSLGRACLKSPLLAYIGSIAAVTAALSLALMAEAYGLGSTGWNLILASILLVICISSPAIGFINWLSTKLIKPHTLPRMDFSKGIPAELKTLVVIPAILYKPEDILELLKGLEVRYHANKDSNLFFGLLTDLQDASQEVMPEDEHILSFAKAGIDALNERYPDKPFFLFHRPRRWNATEGLWMGYERKRGALEDLNVLLHEGSKEGFSLIIGDEAILSGIRYAITLDEDTKMPHGSARLLIETLDHPLNRPRYDELSHCIIEGYSILQPRLNISLPEANRSRFVKIFAGEPGLDPYTREVSDVYQDLFGEGSFAGKGIYDIDAFSRSLKGHLPENTILSHDLLEGCYARAALVSDVQFYENYPYRYTADVSRRHRWIRGDWQIARWLLSTVPGPGGMILDNPISGLSRWKILDNLRRSILPFAELLLLLIGWSMLQNALLWTSIVAWIIFVPPILASAAYLLIKPAELPLGQHLKTSFNSMSKRIAQATLSLMFMPYEAYISVDAILKAIARMTLTHRHLLEWNSSSNSLRNGCGDLASFYKSMWIAPALAIASAVYLAAFRPEALYSAGLILALWFFSVPFAWWISRPLIPYRTDLDESQRIFLRRLSRRTWRFFETFVGPDNNWLPPDNFQESPRSIVANGTSPTNMGLALLSNLAAYDFGYLSAGRLIERISYTMNTMLKMERFRGHFYNWYDIRYLDPLEPKYISTVDSGNLAGHLLVIEYGLAEILDQRILSDYAFEGLKDTLYILMDVIEKRECEASEAGPICPEISIELKRFAGELAASPNSLSSAWLLLDQQARSVSRLIDHLEADVDSEIRWWMNAYEQQIRDHLNDLVAMAPWLMLPLWTMLYPPMDEVVLCRSPEESETLKDLQAELLRLDSVPRLREVPELASKLLPLIDRILECFVGEEKYYDERDWFVQLRHMVVGASQNAIRRIEMLSALAKYCNEFSNIRYDFLFNERRGFLAIGFNVNDLRLDEGCYDLLASEARLSSFVAISQGRLKEKSWFSLGRMLTTAGGELALLSWGGTMFEYLMPLLVMPDYEGTLLNQTYRSVVKQQIQYCTRRGIPWGISESCYNMTDVNLIYQYRAFGVPGLGFKRGLTEDLVIAPYASALALMVEPQEACSNLQKMEALGYLGQYGFYEAIDYTPSRLARDQTSTVVRTFMAHHQGMSFLSLAYLLLNRPMQRRFLSSPMFQARELLLQEKVPKAAPFYPHAAEVSAPLWRAGMPQPLEFIRIIEGPSTAMPEVHLLSNGRYSAMITSSGGGYSRWKDIAVNRWRGDQTLDNEGIFCYIRDLDSGEIWSSTYQPVLRTPDDYRAVFDESIAEFWRRDFGIDTYAAVVVSSEDDIELRSISITNHSRSGRNIELTSYAEVVMANPAADAAHPAFGKLFVQTEILRSKQAILCTRRPSSLDEKNPWMLHLITSESSEVYEISYETDRLKFLGRGRTISDPVSLKDDAPLSDTDGYVLDPIVAIRCRFKIDPGKTVKVNFITGVAQSRDASLGLIEKYHDAAIADRVYNLAWTRGQAMLQQLNVTEADIILFERLAGAILYRSPLWRASPGVITSNRLGQPGLWAYGISGDLPIVLLRIGDRSNLELVRKLMKAHAYWRFMGLSIDLVILNEDGSGYRQQLQDEILGLVASSTEAGNIDKPGGIFVRRAGQMSEDDKLLMQAVSSIIIVDTRGTLEDQMEARGRPEIIAPALEHIRPHEVGTYGAMEAVGTDLKFFNGLGGFTQDGREYIVRIAPGSITPAPWCNVIANQSFGTVISESGSAYTWYENAQLFRLTPWYNDPVTDTNGEAFYIRDDEIGLFWSPTPHPSRGFGFYTCRHGFGYSVFEHEEGGIRSELWIYAAMDAPVKLCALKIRNESGRTRSLSAIGYAELVLGEMPSKTAMHIITEIDPRTGALFARNPYNTEFPGRVAFMDVSDPDRSFTCDRTEFIGRNGTASSPAAMARVKLSGKVGAALDPCAAMQVKFQMAEGQEREIIFILGAGRDTEEARSVVQRFKGSGPARAALDGVWKYWNNVLGVIHIDTPEKELDILTNGWFLYQTLACRIWARSGYYQSSGAYGFRDQLQDVMALLYAEPKIARGHLLLCAAHQFIEGDVQHWWHPPSGRGVRTRISDDFLWLPWAVCRYIATTCDYGVLDEPVNFLEGRQLKPDEDAYYDLPSISNEVGTLYEHCVKAIRNGLKFGEHGLPLMGSGDWNDGMNRVGIKGKGESVWLAFFLVDVLTKFSETAAKWGDSVFAEQCVAEAASLRQKIEENGWDGQWYLRAYFDDGTPLGSAVDPECKIDSISQSWSVLSGSWDKSGDKSGNRSGNKSRSETAMSSVEELLIHEDSSLAQILDPPFEKSDLDPGYIKGYPPGIRENGGQYTQAAVWVAMAFAAMDDRQRAWKVLSMINPISHGLNPEKIDVYKVEPYVIASDVYAMAPHTGRGGWTWYTGAAGWIYRLIIESILGLRLNIDKLSFVPCMPEHWNGFKLHYRHGDTFYHFNVIRSGTGKAVISMKLDGIEQADKSVHLIDDRKDHSVEVAIG